MSEETGEQRITLYLFTRRPSGKWGRMELPLTTTANGGLHRQTAKRIIRFLHSEIRMMDKESAGIEHRPEVEAEFGRGMRSSWPKEE